LVRKLTLTGTLISAISMSLILIFGILPLLKGDIDPIVYQGQNQLRESINIISVSTFIARLGIIIIFSSTLLKTNFILMLGSFAGIFYFSWWEIMDLGNRFIPLNIYLQISGISGTIQIVSVIGAVLFAIGSLMYYKRSKLMVTAGVLILIYALFYTFFLSSVIEMIFGTEISAEKSIFRIIYYSLDRFLFIFAGWLISFSPVAESKKRIDLMGTVFNLDSSHVN